MVLIVWEEEFEAYLLCGCAGIDGAGAPAVATDAEAESLIHNLRPRGDGVEAIVEQEAVGRLATAGLALSDEPRVPVAAIAEPLDLAPTAADGRRPHQAPDRPQGAVPRRRQAASGSGLRIWWTCAPCCAWPRPPRWLEHDTRFR